MGTLAAAADPRAVGSSTTPRSDAIVVAAGVTLVGLLLVAAIAGTIEAAPAAAVMTLVPAGIVDVRQRRLPDAWVAAAAIAFCAVAALVNVTGGEPLPFGSVAAGSVAFTVPILTLHLISPAAMGFGDVKAAAVLGAAAGVIDWRLALVALTLAAGCAGTVGIALRLRTLPFGPFLIGATGIALLTDHVWLPGLAPVGAPP